MNCCERQQVGHKSITNLFLRQNPKRGNFVSVRRIDNILDLQFWGLEMWSPFLSEGAAELLRAFRWATIIGQCVVVSGFIVCGLAPFTRVALFGVSCIGRLRGLG